MIFIQRFAVAGRAILKAQHCDKSLQGLKVTVRAMSATCAPDDVLFEDIGDKGVITLNRPKALNSLNYSMISKIYPTLQQWECEKSLVLIKGAGGKAFCAGGDVVEATVASKKKDTLGKEFFRIEYTTNHLIGTYKIPYVAFIDGITMGGGVGLSVHGKYCVATEKTLFAMPETQIGLFPDVGGTYVLSRLNCEIGKYLALTGARLKGYEMVQAGLATHFIPSEKLPDVEKLLLCSDNPEATLEKYCSKPDTKFSLEPHLQKIERIFCSDSVEDIICKLEKDGSTWAKETLATLCKMCPLSLKVTLEALRRGKSCTFEECLKMEYILVNASCDGHNFIEGVRALLIDKDQCPKWIPDKIEDVTPQMVQCFFEAKPYKGDLELDRRGGSRASGRDALQKDKSKL